MGPYKKASLEIWKYEDVMSNFKALITVVKFYRESDNDQWWKAKIPDALAL